MHMLRGDRELTRTLLDERLGRSFVLDPAEDALPREHLLAARHVRHRPARHPRGDPDARVARSMPAELYNVGKLKNGIVLVTGPTGSGKSTTLAAIINQINQEQAYHIITIEDPVEYMHRHMKSTVNQREVGRGHQDLLAGPARRAAAGAEGDPHRRDARRRDDRDRHGGGGDRPPRALDAAHDRRGQDRRPHHRRLPEGPGAADPHALLAVVPLRHLAAPAAEDRRRARGGAGDPEVDDAHARLRA